MQFPGYVLKNYLIKKVGFWGILALSWAAEWGCSSVSPIPLSLGRHEPYPFAGQADPTELSPEA